MWTAPSPGWTCELSLPPCRSWSFSDHPEKRQQKWFDCINWSLISVISYKSFTQGIGSMVEYYNSESLDSTREVKHLNSSWGFKYITTSATSQEANISGYAAAVMRCVAHLLWRTTALISPLRRLNCYVLVLGRIFVCRVSPRCELWFSYHWLFLVRSVSFAFVVYDAGVCHWTYEEQTLPLLNGFSPFFYSCHVNKNGI